MKKVLFLFSFIIIISACNKQKTNNQGTNNSEQVKSNSSNLNMKEISFNDLFNSVEPKEFDANPIKLLAKNYAVLTSGDTTKYNSMTVGWGGWGIYFEDPSTWLMLRANRYTLEFIREKHTYTMCFFDTTYMEQVLLFGSTSGRNSDKMQQHKLTSVQTPNGNMAYKEAFLIIECELSQISTVHPDDFCFNDMKEFINGGFEEAKDYHKMVFGKIKAIWKKK